MTRPAIPTALLIAAALMLLTWSFVAAAADGMENHTIRKPIASVVIPDRANAYRRDLTRQARMVWGLDAPIATFAAQIHQESAWRPDARSPYAHGLAQFTPATADWIAELDPLLASADTGNPIWALRALVTYDRWLFERLPGDDCPRMHLALRAYNGGLVYIKREIATGKACRAFRAEWACRENLDYPVRILNRNEPAYVEAGWGRGVCA